MKKYGKSNVALTSSNDYEWMNGKGSVAPSNLSDEEDDQFFDYDPAQLRADLIA